MCGYDTEAGYQKLVSNVLCLYGVEMPPCLFKCMTCVRPCSLSASLARTVEVFLCGYLLVYEGMILQDELVRPSNWLVLETRLSTSL